MTRVFSAKPFLLFAFPAALTCLAACSSSSSSTPLESCIVADAVAH